jgi:hypothetical protein
VRALELHEAIVVSMVPVACARPSVVLTGLLRSTAKAPSFSIAVSPFTATLIVFEIWPGSKVSVPDAVV